LNLEPKVNDKGRLSFTKKRPFGTRRALCVWQAGLAHFGILFWPTPGTLKVWEIFIPVVVAAVGMWESLLSDFQGLWEGWENSFIVFPCFP
jgi:hypothetical protein